MVADRKRRLKDGREFDHLFPLPGETDTTIKRSANVEDTMTFIRQALPQTLWQTQKIAKVLKGRTLAETCSNIWHFVYEHIQYKRDEDGVEQVRSPRRAWRDRKTGVDCDCYTVFILSILRSLDIACIARVTKYPKRYPEVPRWQHVYPIVPKAGYEEDYSADRDHYIVIDCVKDKFDDEQPYLECIDYDMRLDYLDGIEQEETHDDNIDFVEHDSVDLADLASIYDEEEMGNIFKKIGGAVKKVAGEIKSSSKVLGKQIKETANKVGDKIGDGVRFLNRYLNPATILLRNGFLLAMKINLLNVAGKLRYAYLTDAQAQAKGMNLSELKKLQTVKDRAETVYWQAGGKKNNLKKAILGGKGNKDKKVPLSGFEGVDGLDNVYADYDEYNIIHSDNLEGLGEIASGTAIAAATSAVAAIATALSQVKGLFSKGGSEEQAFQSSTDNAGTASTAPAMISEDEEVITNDIMTSATAPISTARTFAPTPSITSRLIQPFTTPATAIARQIEQKNTSSNNETQAYSSSSSGGGAVLPDQFTARRDVPATIEDAAKSTAIQTQNSTSGEEGFLQKTTDWVKQNPGKSLLVTGGIVAGGFLIAKALKRKSATTGLSGLPGHRKKKRKFKKKRSRGKRNQVKRQILL